MDEENAIKLDERLVNKIVDMLSGNTSIVYFIRCNEYLKIGTSQQDIIERMGNLQVGNPYKLKLEYFVLGSYGKEKELHRKFKEFKVDGHGEWFKLTKEQVLEGIKELYG